MPRMDAAVYAAHMDSVLKLARRNEGVSRPQIINDLNVTRAVASGLIEKCGLALSRTDGRTEYYSAPAAAETDVTEVVAPAPPKVKAPAAAKQSKVPAPAKAEARPESTDAAEVTDDTLAELDAQILDARSGLREAAAKAGKALGQWATHQAVVDALRERMTMLATKRMNASS